MAGCGGYYGLRAEEVGNFIRVMVDELRANPLLNIDNLAYVGMVVSAIGHVKRDNVLKILGDLLSEAPDKLRPILSLRYTLVGTIGELQVALNKLAEEAFNELLSILEEVADALSSDRPARERLADLAGKLYDLLVIRLPAVSLTAAGAEAE